MDVMEVVHYPSPILEQVCDEVIDFGEELRKISEDMAVTMYASKGVGLAGPQVGLKKRIIVVDPTAGNTKDGLIVLVNPRITWESKELVSLLEGCLSLPGTIVTLERPECIEVTYQNVSGEMKTANFAGWPSRIIQHETDHLNGVMMFDKLNKTERGVLLKCHSAKKRRETRKRA